MQESLRLIQIPQVDTSRLSSVGDFRRTVEQIERRYGLNLEFNDNARWRPGSYERLKEQVTKALFPHWSKPKGANTIRRLTRHESYRCNNLANDLIKIDDELREFRQIGQTLDADKAAVEGRELLNEYMANITEPTNGVRVEITSLPYFARVRRSNNGRARIPQIFEPSWDAPLHPKYDRAGELISYNIGRSQVEELYKVYNLNTNPQRWFINIIVPLEDVNIEYYMKSDESGVVCTNPYGDLVVCFTMPIYDAVLNYRTVKRWNPKKQSQHQIVNKIQTSYYSNYTFKFPYAYGIQHPFIQSGGNRYSYDMGNTCFGDFKNDVILALSTGMMGQLRALLTKWSSTYYLGRTSPLNQTETHHIGMPKEWVGTGIPDYMGTNINLCRNIVREGTSRDQMLARFCSNCALTERTESRDRCGYYLSMTKEPVPVPSSYLKAIDDKIEDLGLPGLAHSWNIAQAKRVIQSKAIEMWNFASNLDGNDLLSHDISRIWGAEDRGSGNCDWHMFENLCSAFVNNVSEYDDTDAEDLPYNALLARDTYLLYRYCERIYWLDSIGSYGEDLLYELSEDVYSTIEKAEEGRPVADYRLMVNTYRVSTNQPLYPEYLDILKPNSEREIELDDTLNAWLHANDEEREVANERNPF